MKHLRALHFVLAAVVAAFAAPPPRAAGAPVRVLFIGNSYTYYNNMPELVAQLSGGMIETRMVVRGGASLQQSWDLGQAPAAIREGKWDWVVIQEQSLLGGMRIDGTEQVNEPDFFFDNVRMYDAEIRKVKAKTMLYLTWARRAAPEQQAFLTHAYTTIAQELGLTVAPVGVAWQRAREKEPSLILHAADGSHPSPLGSYLAACVFVKTILGPQAPSTLPAKVNGHPIAPNEQPDLSRTVDLVNLSPERAELLQEFAEQAVAVAPQTRPATPARNPLPVPKRPASPGEMTGTWKGWLKYYPVPMNAELRLTQGTGRQCSGQWTIWSQNDDRRLKMPITACRYTDVGVTFVVSDYKGAGPGETFWAHFTGETLTGWADYRGLKKSSRLMGSFELRRIRP